MRFWIYIIGALLFIAAAISELGCSECPMGSQKRKAFSRKGTRILAEKPYRGAETAISPQWKESRPESGYIDRSECPGGSDCKYSVLARVELHNPAAHPDTLAEVSCEWWLDNAILATNTIKRVRVRAGKTVVVELQQVIQAKEGQIGRVVRKIKVTFTSGLP